VNKNDLQIFKSLFKGREDVFAIRWEKGDKSGYMPAYKLDWNEFAKHKSKGGTLKDYPDKEFLTLTDDKIANHLAGKETIGIYPLLANNTSWFIVADFDQSTTKRKTWVEECQLFIKKCSEYDLPVYLERSRSGNGGHVWMFFEQEYPAYRSRKIFLHILFSCGIGSLPAKESNFDRLFPNQDYHSGKGLGNLIALPFQKKSLEKGNSVFIDDTLLPYSDQWDFLNKIKRGSIEKLDSLYNNISGSSPVKNNSYQSTNDYTDELQIRLSNQITISRVGMNNQLIRFLREELSFMNADYFIKKNTGKSTYQTERFITSIEETGQNVILPRGFVGKLLRYCMEKNVKYQFKDERQKGEIVTFTSSISLYDYQQAAISATDKKDFGVIVAPPGSGTTLMALSIIANKQLPALIIVHRKQLFDQWIERIQSFLGIPKYRIGQITGGKSDIGEDITVAMVQSLQATELPESVYHKFGTIIVDECHHIPAKTFRGVIQKFHSYFLYGFTATPKRKRKDEKLIFIHIGEIIHEVIIPVGSAQHKQFDIVIKDTEFITPFQIDKDKIELLMNILIHDAARNEVIIHDIQREVTAGRKILVLTERKIHIEILNQYLKSKYEIIVLTGDDNEQARKIKLKQVTENNFQILLATGQFIGEGADFNALDCLVLAYPFSFEGKLIQYMGRVQRSNTAPVIYDYRDYKIEYLDNLYKQRNKYYRKLMHTGQLKKYDELLVIFEKDQFYINANEFSIECLDLPMAVEEFNPDIIWKLRVLDYNDETGKLSTEIIDYKSADIYRESQLSFYYYGIEKITFKNIDTGKFLQSVILKKHLLSDTKKPIDFIKQESPAEYVIVRKMKVPFRNISFLYGNVSFPIFIEELGQEIVFEMANADIRPEFEAVKEYFIKVMKKKLLLVDIVIRYTDTTILSATVQSDDISNINTSLIESVRFEFIKKQILKPGNNVMGEGQMHTIDTLIPQDGKKLYYVDANLIDDILNIKKSRHYLQLKYLSAKHESMILKLRFVLQPFSFIFLLSGEKKYHIIWETLDTEEATYIWHTHKIRESLKEAISKIEIIINEIKQSGRQNFLRQNDSEFTRVVHDYTDAKKGFIIWKGLFEAIII
jgi:superfamily II DNA or RNA helicase